MRTVVRNCVATAGEKMTRALFTVTRMRALPILGLCVLSYFLCSVATAQSYLTQVGSTTFSTTLPVELGYYDSSTGDLHLAVSLGSWPQRGGYSVTASLVYDSRIWYINNNVWNPNNIANSMGGWRLEMSPIFGGTVNDSEAEVPCNNGYKELAYYTYSNFTWTDSQGTLHTFPIQTQKDPFDCGVGNDPSGSAYATDSTGYFMTVTNYTSASISGPDGSQVYPSFKDRNGNYFSADSNGNLIDTLGRTPVTVTTDCNSNSRETCYDVLNSQGGTSRYTVVTESVSVNTAFHQSGITEYSGSIPAISTITLPDNTNYSFTYDTATYGELTGTTLSAGGQVSYTYTTFFDDFNNANRWLYTRTSGGGQWTYAPSTTQGICIPGYSYCQSVMVTKPSGDQIQYDFNTNAGSNGSWAGIALFYHNGGQVGSIDTTWTSTSTYAQKQSVTWTPQDSSSPFPQRMTEYTYGNSSLPFYSEISEWNYYALGNQPSTPTRLTTFSSYCDGSPGSVTVTNGAGTQTFAQTKTTFDSYGSGLISVTGVTHHDDTNFGVGYTTRCNPTSISQLVGSSTYITTSMTYDMTGEIRSNTDANNNTTTLSYTDSFYSDNNANPPASYTPSAPTNAYLTTVTLPVIGAQTTGYYYGTGQMALSTDQNGATTYDHDFDSFSRPTEAVLPSGGWNAIAYTGQTQTDSYLGITNGTPSTSCSSGCRHDETTTDGLGRPNYSYLVSDPDGETTVATSYDTNSRVSSVTNPYRTAGNGQDTYAYDWFDRVTQITHTDGTAINVFYGALASHNGGIATQLCSSSTYGLGYQALTVDEAGKKREVWTDGFGRTIEVDEPDSSNNLTKNTCYGYDLNNNLLQVVSATGQTRTYTFDDLSRLTAVATPETYLNGTQYSTAYSYTKGGSLCSGNPNSVCVRTDPRGITATYAYDGLNRVTSITYSDGTPTVTYCYDGNNSTCISGGYSSSYGKGRRTAMSDGSGNTGWSYNSVGLVQTEQRTIAGIEKTISYGYNYDGSINSITYPSGRVVTYVVSGAQRATQVTDSNGTQYAMSATYAPTGTLVSAIYGQVSGGFGGITETRSYNNRLELTSIQASSANGNVLNLAPCFTAFSISSNTPCSSSATGNNSGVTGIANSIDSNETQAFGYDNLNRISSGVTKSTSGNDCWGQGFTIDPVANLTGISITQCSAGSLSVSTDGYNHLVATGYTYDNAGDMTDDAANAYFYDAEHRLIQVNGTLGSCSSATACYVYDGDGLRVKKSTGLLYWRSTAGDALAESNLSGGIQVERVFFAGRQIAAISSGTTVNYFFSDALGTNHTVTNATGTPCYDASFTPYGQEVLNPNISQTCSPNYRFTGYEYDSETGNYYAFARYYSSRLGRFMTPDPAQGSQDSCQSLNLYAYTSNIPTSFSDPSGLDSCPLVIAGTYDNPQNSKAILDFAAQIGANVVFPLPSSGGFASDATNSYSSSSIAAVSDAIAASSGPNGGPSSVITFSAGAAVYGIASTVASQPSNVAYVMPYTPSGYVGIAGKDTTTVFTGTGFVNRLLQAITPSVPDADYVNLQETHDQNNVFPTLLQHLPFHPGPGCKNRQVFIAAGGSGGPGYMLEPMTGCGEEGCYFKGWTWVPLV